MLASTVKPSRSTRRKTIPVPAAAGRIRSVTEAPLCSPTPRHSTGIRIVCSKLKRNDIPRSVNRLHAVLVVQSVAITHFSVAQTLHFARDSPWVSSHPPILPVEFAFRQKRAHSEEEGSFRTQSLP